MMFDECMGLEAGWLFKAQAGRHYPARAIAEGVVEFELLVAGRGAFELNGGMREAAASSVLCFGPGDAVVAAADQAEPYAALVLRFRLASSLDFETPSRFEWEDLLSCRRFSSAVLAEISAKGLGDSELCAELYARLQWERRCHARRLAKASRPASVEAALAFIERNCSARISVADIAAASGVSEAHLHGLFAKHLGSSPFQTLLKRRLEKARELLSSSDLTLKEICQRIAFSDVKNFCVSFKREMKLTPGAYRRLAQGR